MLFSREFITPINSFFIYRSGDDQWQDAIYRHRLEPSKNIILIVIDENTVNTLQAQG